MAWIDASTGAYDVVTYDLDTQVATRLTDDAAADENVSVSPDGTVIVWTKCQSARANCDVWQATRGDGGAWVTAQLTGAAGDESLPSTNGQVVVYYGARNIDGSLERDIYWQPVGGGAESRLALAGDDTRPHLIRNDKIVFEHRTSPANHSSNFDVYLYDIATSTLYQLTDSPQDEMLNNAYMDANGLIRVVWAVQGNDASGAGSSFNVYASTFRLPTVVDTTPRHDRHADAGDEESGESV